MTTKEKKPSLNSDNLEIEIEDYPKNDCLKIVRILCIDIFQYKIIKFLLIWALNICVLITVVQSYFFLKYFDLIYFVKYAPMFFALQIATVTIGGNIALSDVPTTELKLLDVWKIKNVNHKISKQFEKQCLIVTLWTIISVTLGTFSGFLMMISGNDNQDIFFIYSLIDNYVLHEWKLGISLWFSVCCAFLCFVGVASMYQFVYGTFHIKFQIEILLNFLTAINDRDKDESDAELLNCKKYQDEIKYCLRFIGDRHSKLKKCLIFLYTTVGGLFVISIMFFLLTFEGDFVSTYVRMVPICMTGFLVGGTIIMSGQYVQDVSSMILEISCQLNWYMWNKENKMMYLIILINSFKPFKIKFSENMSVNYELGLNHQNGVFNGFCFNTGQKS
ncbi:hypothetical protein BDFB_011840, partial [Asbolus verrucosus]